MKHTEQKVAILAGASQSIGAGLVNAFRDLGYRVVGISRSIKGSGDVDVLTGPGDIAKPDTAGQLVERGLDRFGRIDSLVNNAGIFIGKRFTDYTEANSTPSVWKGIGEIGIVGTAAAVTNAGLSRDRRAHPRSFHHHR